MYTTLAFLALLGAPYMYIYIYDISSLRVKHFLFIELISEIKKQSFRDFFIWPLQCVSRKVEKSLVKITV